MDMKVTMPGVWYVLHTEAIDTSTKRKQKEYIDLFYRIIAKLKCPECRIHAADYARRHNIREFIRLRDPLGRNGLFFYTWQFHNDVNLRLGKPTMDFADAWTMYAPDDMQRLSYSSSVCTTCGGY